MGPETACHLGPRQTEGFLYELKALGEVAREDLGYSGVMNALSRLGGVPLRESSPREK